MFYSHVLQRKFPSGFAKLAHLDMLRWCVAMGDERGYEMYTTWVHGDFGVDQRARSIHVEMRSERSIGRILDVLLGI